MIKRIVIVLALLSMPLIVGLLFTYDIVKIEWISMMEIQPSFRAQEDPCLCRRARFRYREQPSSKGLGSA
jgi:hypothetical protein